MKRILGIGVPVAGAFGADEAHLDIAAVESAPVPRITLRYRNLPLEMYFRPVPDDACVATESARDVTGRYKLSDESVPFAPRGVSSVDVSRADGLPFADLDGVGISRMVLCAAHGTGLAGDVFQAERTRETFRFEGDRLYLTGLTYERRP